MNIYYVILQVIVGIICLIVKLVLAVYDIIKREVIKLNKNTKELIRRLNAVTISLPSNFKEAIKKFDEILHTKVCLIYKKGFIPYWNEKYCSDKCRKIGYNKRLLKYYYKKKESICIQKKCAQKQ